MLRDIFESLSGHVGVRGTLSSERARSEEEVALRQRNSGLSRSIDSRIRQIFRTCDELGADIDHRVSSAVNEAERRLRE